MRRAWQAFIRTGANPWIWRVVGHPDLHVSLHEVEEHWDTRRLIEALAWCDLHGEINRAPED